MTYLGAYLGSSSSISVDSAAASGTTTVRHLIDDARMRHWSFADARLPDGAALRFVNERQRSLILRAIDDVGPFIGSTQEVAATVDGALVGISSDGVPYYATTITDGFPVHLDEDEVPYVDPTETPITTDPFGESGETPGFPLPASTIRVLAAVAVMDDESTRPIEVLAESVRHEWAGSRALQAFVSANRLVPLRPSPVTTGHLWDSVSAVQLSYVATPLLTALDDVLTLPETFHEPLTAAVAELLAGASRECSTSDKRHFTAQRQEADLQFAAHAGNALAALTTQTVAYRG